MTLQLFLDSLSPKTEKLSLEGIMDLSRDRLILELEFPIVAMMTSLKSSGISSKFYVDLPFVPVKI
jgi:hypothetical protein